MLSVFDIASDSSITCTTTGAGVSATIGEPSRETGQQATAPSWYMHSAGWMESQINTRSIKQEVRHGRISIETRST